MLRHRISLLALIAALVVVSTDPRGFAQSRPLKILLTNDDGFDSAGLKTMRDTLVAAGHQVVVVAPATNMSSTGMSMTSGVIKLESKGTDVWAVHGTPADAATIGINHILRDSPQDLVVSGTNAGQNLGTSANSSGTVSAAIAASRYGVPAIATSAGIGANATTAYAVAAAIAKQMIQVLDASRPSGAKLLPDRIVINVNVPAVAAGQLKGLKWTPLSRTSSYARVYEATGTPNEVRSRLTAAPPPKDETDTDVAFFNQGYVTLTLLDGEMGVGAGPTTTALVDRLSKLALPVP